MPTPNKFINMLPAPLWKVHIFISCLSIFCYYFPLKQQALLGQHWANDISIGYALDHINPTNLTTREQTATTIQWEQHRTSQLDCAQLVALNTRSHKFQNSTLQLHSKNAIIVCFKNCSPPLLSSTFIKMSLVPRWNLHIFTSSSPYFLTTLHTDSMPHCANTGLMI